ncbi:heterokaryon incompatibility protein-domain-containing protein [Penicillium hetheringtonii]|uniref:Heterokaryon incompatibility protein-domain-containing protein n=1 Tax=Penicillium hetheringtonii TaxID=911720 RepID=A0AAD6D809_9EURO|nr:heterokaryon incompatibility protein-domain-containing protein [Penicillium hetheringtonii]
MRLLKAAEIQLEEFTPDRIPDYAILSHTWEREEILLEDLRNGSVYKKVAWEKVKRICQQTLEDGLEFVWIDTCCIDKTSSAELSEAINSMFSWYQNARTCYIYLNDVPAHGDIRQKNSKFASSRWFTRGWTLQELLVPREMCFFSCDWVKLGRRRSLISILYHITKIPEGLLIHSAPLQRIAIAEKMFWASQRKTTRPEDMAYCLMGLFDVNMPLLYGEGGTKVFIRLQEEIMKASDDNSLFAWIDRTLSPENWYRPYGLLAISVRYFADSQSIVSMPLRYQSPFSMTNKGLHIDLPLMTTNKKGLWVATLGCGRWSDDRYLPVDIYLKERNNALSDFTRVGVDCLPVPQETKLSKTKAIYIRQN